MAVRSVVEGDERLNAHKQLKGDCHSLAFFYLHISQIDFGALTVFSGNPNLKPGSDKLGFRTLFNLSKCTFIFSDFSFVSSLLFHVHTTPTNTSPSSLLTRKFLFKENKDTRQI